MKHTKPLPPIPGERGLRNVFCDMPKPQHKLRLVKVVVQPVFVLDDGEQITEIEHPATVIPASEWPTYSGERFPRELAEWQAHLDATQDD